MEIRFGRVNTEKACAYLVSKGGTFPYGASAEAASLLAAAENEGFDGSAGQSCALHDLGAGKVTILAGIGENAEESEKVRRAVAAILALANKKQVLELGLPLSNAPATVVRAVAEAARLAPYRYTEYLTSPKESFPETLWIECGEETAAAAQEGLALAEAVCIARDLVNEPSNVQTPARLAKEASALALKYGLEAEILDESQIEALDMRALMAVGKGSPNPSRVIVLRYRGAPDEPNMVTALVGKGVTYDSGGLNLKSGARFITMKHDMAGGATVIGAICAIAAQKLHANVTAIVAACENLISGEAYRPGDIIGSMAGKTIEITSTDAEGRLTLIDALYYAANYEHATRLIDIATLTGSARKILGEFGAPLLSNDGPLAKSLLAAAQETDELLFQIPLVEDARKQIKGVVSDYVNSSQGQTGGLVTAALFIEAFTMGLPWAHIDAAGPLWLDRDQPYTPQGGSGWGVRTLYRYIKDLSCK